MLVKNERVLLSLGMFSLAAAILLKRIVGRFIEEAAWLFFLEGVLIGGSIVFNLAYLIRLKRRKHTDAERSD